MEIIKQNENLVIKSWYNTIFEKDQLKLIENDFQLTELIDVPACVKKMVLKDYNI